MNALELFNLLYKGNPAVSEKVISGLHAKRYFSETMECSGPCNDCDCGDSDCGQCSDCG